jgi:hypothetical protein
MKAKRKKPGPPARYGRRPTLTVRLQKKVYDDVKQSAKGVRSISEEIERRVEAYAAVEAMREQLEERLADARRLAREAQAAVDAAHIQAIRLAGGQIVREAGGAVTVNVSPELLLAEAAGVLRSGFAAPGMTQEMLTRIVEATVAAVMHKEREP